MDRTLSWLAGAHNPNATERTLAEIDSAISMVSLGVATTVRLVNLPAAEDHAFDAAARAQAAGIAFSLKRDEPGSVALVIGPRLRHDLASPEPETSPVSEPSVDRGEPA